MRDRAVREMTRPHGPVVHEQRVRLVTGLDQRPRLIRLAGSMRFTPSSSVRATQGAPSSSSQIPAGVKPTAISATTSADCGSMRDDAVRVLVRHPHSVVADGDRVRIGTDGDRLADLVAARSVDAADFARRRPGDPDRPASGRKAVRAAGHRDRHPRRCVRLHGVVGGLVVGGLVVGGLATARGGGARLGVRALLAAAGAEHDDADNDGDDDRGDDRQCGSRGPGALPGRRRSNRGVVRRPVAARRQVAARPVAAREAAVEAAPAARARRGSAASASRRPSSRRPECAAALAPSARSTRLPEPETSLPPSGTAPQASSPWPAARSRTASRAPRDAQSVAHGTSALMCA